MGKYLSAFFLVSAFIILVATPGFTETIQYPAWYGMSIDLDPVMELERPLTLTVKIEALVAELKDTRVRLTIPEGWQHQGLTKAVESIKAGETKKLEFSVTPTSYLAQGSIVAEAKFNVPFDGLAAKVKEMFPQEADVMISHLQSWPKVSERYAEVSFAFLEEESVVPLGKAIWRNYYDKLAPQKGFRGPVFYDDPGISSYQAQTDVEMFEKLVKYTTADPALAQKLAASGVDLNKKRYDQLNGLYVLATRAFSEENHDQALGFIEKLEGEIDKLDSNLVENLKIASLNLKAIIFWDKGQKRLAQNFFKKAFYTNRKHELQRYVLRNIGLLMFVNGEKAMAEHMMKLGLSIGPGYRLLDKEVKKVRSP